MQKKRIRQRERRHKRVRKKVFSKGGRPRLCVYRSLNNLSAQIIDDDNGRTLLSLSTFDKNIRNIVKYGGNIKAASTLGKLIAEKAKTKGITAVIFDRGGCRYHGRIKTFAEAAREAGLVF